MLTFVFVVLLVPDKPVEQEVVVPVSTPVEAETSQFSSESQLYN
jgi:hypothetical protein